MARQERGGAHVMSVRLDEKTYQRVKAYAIASNMKESAALRDLACKGLASDGLELYATELGQFLRSVMNGVLTTFDEALEQRNAEQEDRIARVVARSAKQASVASLICTDLAKGLFPNLKEVPIEKVYAEYSRRAGEMQAGKSFEEARRHGTKS